ncbi:MAG: hypothetical protein IJO32_02225 [Bacilli bacterium]|nr:hypothetical protein [Bacilli bacterium]
MKNKKILCSLLAIFTMFFMVGEVSAISFNDATIANKAAITSALTNNKKGNLSYYISSTYDNGAYLRENPNFGKYSNEDDAKHGSINIFGYDGTRVYEISSINNINSAQNISGIFPVFYIGNGETLDATATLYNDYKYLSESSGVLTGTSDGITVTVTPSFVHGNQYIMLTYTAKNTSGATKNVSMAGYSDLQLDGVDNVALTPETNIGGKGAKGFSMSVKTSTNANRNLYVITDDFGGIINNDDVNYWIGNKNYTVVNNEYSQAFKKSTGFDSTVTEKNTAMAFSWNNIEIANNETVTRTVLIGLGDITYSPTIDVNGESEYNLDNVKNVNVNIKYNIPTDGNAYKLYYKLNDGDIVTVNDVDLTKVVDATKVLDLINDENLNKCGDNTLTAWIGPSTDSSLSRAVVKDEHKFKVTAASCIPEKQEENPQSGVNTNYLILGLILVGGIGVYVYGRKHNKFPQV